ncbi:MAG: SpaA isopeptide-forming pilin-related protein, partial [Caldilinea sp.]|nr:SpaA isopeptide-forming pilin-related protein [Caldilinea sp.]
SVRVFVADGTPPSGSNGLPGIVVELTAPTTVTQSQTSDEFGTATFINLVPGEYKVEIVDTSALKNVTPLTGAITVATVFEGAAVSVQFPFTGTTPTRYQHLPLIRR